MTKNSREKRAARDYQAAHPGMLYPAALRIVRAARAYLTAHPGTSYPDALSVAEAGPVAPPAGIDEILIRAIDADRTLTTVELNVDDVEERLSAFHVNLGPDIEEGPVYIDSAYFNDKSLTYDIHEEFASGTVVGEARIEAELDWRAYMFKATYYAADEATAPWEVSDYDHNDQYVEVVGQMQAEVIYHFQLTQATETVEALTVEGVAQRPAKTATAV